MKYFSDNNQSFVRFCRKGFSLVEAMGALMILAIFSSTVLVVVNRCMNSVADSVLRMQAFEVARDNMEKLLSAESVSETADYGDSEKYPQIQWQTTTETFQEPLKSGTWLKAICSAEFIDQEGQIQTVELTNWLTHLTEADLLKIDEQKQWDEEELIATIEEAAEYIEVDVEIIEQWTANGMHIVRAGEYQGYFIISELELYLETDGRPTAEDRRKWKLREREDAYESEEPTDDETDKPTDSTPDGKRKPKSKPTIDLDKFPPELRELIKQLLAGE